MRRTERLFQIIQILRRRRLPITAQALAAELETSVRTVYRDIAELQAQRVPVRGEAGVGYLLDKGYDLPPLMLTPDEIEAAVLGAQWVSLCGDPALARNARDLIAKLYAVAPQHLRELMQDSAVMVAQLQPAISDQLEMGRIRAAIRNGRKLELSYVDQAGEASTRVIWPVCVVYFEAVRLLVGWCELRQDFRHFRTDRIQGVNFLTQTYPARPRDLFQAWREVETCRNARLIFRPGELAPEA